MPEAAFGGAPETFTTLQECVMVDMTFGLSPLQPVTPVETVAKPVERGQSNHDVQTDSHGRGRGRERAGLPAAFDLSPDRLMAELRDAFADALQERLPALRRDLHALFRITGFDAEDSEILTEAVFDGGLDEAIAEVAAEDGAFGFGFQASYTLEVRELQIAIDNESGSVAVSYRSISISHSISIAAIASHDLVGDPRPLHDLGGSFVDLDDPDRGIFVAERPLLSPFAAAAKSLESFSNLIVIDGGRSALALEAASQTILTLDLFTPFGPGVAQVADEPEPTPKILADVSA